MLNYFKFELMQYRIFRRLFRRMFNGEFYYYKTSRVPGFWSDKELDRVKYIKYEVHTKKRVYRHDFEKGKYHG